MKKSKATKRTLLLSVLAMLLCMVMLVGTTFAWFTDSASTAVNTIQAGTLDVQLLDADGTSIEGQTLTWKTADDRAQDQILWEPGCTYELQPFKIKNNGNLALKVYNQTNDRYFTKSSLNTQGIGIIMKKDFTNFLDLFGTGKKKKKKKNPK